MSASSSKFPWQTENSSTEDTEIGSHGLKKRIIQQPTSWRIPFPGDQVQVHYNGHVVGGESLDSSRENGTPFTFRLGSGEVIKGWDEGISTMKKGERAIFTIPPNLAYGDVGCPPLIPPNATLIFDVELLSWNSIRDLSGDGGILKKIIREGEGWLSPKDPDEVLVKYEARLEDETIISKSDGVEFHVSDDYLCPAINKAVKTMKKGEKAEIFLKYTYDLGQNGNQATKNGFCVPPNSKITVEIELVSWKSVVDVTGDKKVVKKIIRAGEGYDQPSEGSYVKVKYIGKLEDGTIFERGGSDEEPFEFKCFAEQVLDGLDRGIMTMKRGERALVTLTSDYGLGEVETQRDLAMVPANAKLVYEVELISFTKGAEYVEYDHYFTDEEKVQANELKVSCNLNNATCKLKLGDYVDALRLCTKVLELDPYNIKALYRRSQTYLRISEFDKAESDIKRALSLDPNNRDLRLEYKNLKEKQKEFDRNQAKVFGTMFSRMGQLEI